MTKTQSQTEIAVLANLIEELHHAGSCAKAIQLIQKRITTIQLQQERGKK